MDAGAKTAIRRGGVPPPPEWPRESALQALPADRVSSRGYATVRWMRTVAKWTVLTAATGGTTQRIHDPVERRHQQHHLRRVNTPSHPQQRGSRSGPETRMRPGSAASRCRPAYNGHCCHSRPRRLEVIPLNSCAYEKVRLIDPRKIAYAAAAIAARLRPTNVHNSRLRFRRELSKLLIDVWHKITARVPENLICCHCMARCLRGTKHLRHRPRGVVY